MRLRLQLRPEIRTYCFQQLVDCFHRGGADTITVTQRYLKLELERDTGGGLDDVREDLHEVLQCGRFQHRSGRIDAVFPGERLSESGWWLSQHNARGACHLTGPRATARRQFDPAGLD